MGSSLMLRLHWHPSALKISYKENYVMMSKIGCLQSTPSCNFWPFLVINESQIRRQRVAPGVKLHKQWEGKRRNRKLRLSEGTRAHNRLTSQDFVFFFLFSFLFYRTWQLTGKGASGGAGFSQRRGWRRTVGGCGWSRPWPRRRSRFLVTSPWRCWSATGICCAVERTVI